MSFHFILKTARDGQMIDTSGNTFVFQGASQPSWTGIKHPLYRNSQFLDDLQNIPINKRFRPDLA